MSGALAAAACSSSAARPPLAVQFLFAGSASDFTANVAGASGQTAGFFEIIPSGGSGSYPTMSYFLAAGTADSKIVNSGGTTIALGSSAPLTIVTAATLYVGWFGMSIGDTLIIQLHANVTDSDGTSVPSSTINVILHRTS